MKTNIAELSLRILRRLTRLAENYNIGEAAQWRKEAPDCFSTIRAIGRLPQRDPKIVFDIGAHVGRWAQTFSACFPKTEHIVLFEPSAEGRRRLEMLQLRRCKTTIVPVALGIKTYQGYLRGGGASASLLPAAAQKDVFPGSIRDVQERVDVSTLDAVSWRMGLPAPDLIKIDVQGAELDVLRGGERTIASAATLVVELSTTSLYEGQPSLDEHLALLRHTGWILTEIGHIWRDPKNCRILQFDGIFQRP